MPPQNSAGAHRSAHLRRWWRRWGRVGVEGLSMIPELAPGDQVIVHWGSTIQPGDVVVARRPDRPDLLVVKRAIRLSADGWWLEGDNPGASDDSRVFGTVRRHDVVGRVVARIHPRPMRRLRREP